MIRVSRLDGKEFVINSDLIEAIEETPDTVLRLVNGDKFVVRQPIDEVIARIVAYQRRVRCAEPPHVDRPEPA